ncbi:MAG: structural protein MipA [Erythrobacteraceae bacterium]|nr:structural protein MipA [Erythrobacteraceae bacterium]
MKLLLAATGSLALACAAPAMAQNVEALPDGPDGEATVFDGNWFSIGAGAVYSASYDGSDDYVVSPIPIVQGKIGGVRISPRAGGAALDFVNDDSDGTKISAGVAARLNRNRASQIEDPVVLSYGELDTAFEVGPSVGISLPGLLNPYDSLSFNIDAVWDVAGAHNGMSVNPSITYFTPLSRGIAVSLSVSAKHIDDEFADYYYSVPAGGPLPEFQAEGGFESAGVNLLGVFDLDGDVTNGGLALIALGGYSRMLGDAKRTPFTSIRGDADQWMGAVGVGYTF